MCKRANFQLHHTLYLGRGRRFVRAEVVGNFFGHSKVTENREAVLVTGCGGACMVIVLI